MRISGIDIIKGFFSVFLFILLSTSENAVAIENGKHAEMKKINQIPQEQWDKLANMTFYFGHQSVGYNILSGIQDVLAANPHIKLRILETTNIEDFNNPLLGHSVVGKNRFPETKIDEFVEILESETGKNVDVAFLKYCYVDVNADTDAKKMFFEYVRGIERIQKVHPDIKIIHFTIPLRAISNTFVEKVKRRIGLGKEFQKAKGNIVKSDYNSMIRQRYADKGLVFDIAHFESITPNGDFVTFNYKDKNYPTLYHEYTDDGGHLNNLGRVHVAQQLLVFLAENIK